MKTFFSSLLVFLAANYIRQRGWYWEKTERFRRGQRINVIKGKTFRFENFGLITRRLYEQEPFVRFNKAFEQRTLSAIIRILKPEFTVLDIGANIGLHSLIMASCLDSDGKGMVYSFEPCRKTFEALMGNVKLNNFSDRIVPHNVALSDKAGRLILDTPDEYRSLGHRSDPYKSLRKGQNGLETGEEVEVVTLDLWVKEKKISRIDFIKIDIEGAELECFKGSVDVLKNYRPIVVMECYEQYCRRFGYCVTDVVHFMAGLDYKMYQYEESQWIAFPNEIEHLGILTDLLS